MRAPDYPENEAHDGERPQDKEGYCLGIGGIETVSRLDHHEPQNGPHDPQPEKYAHSPSLPYDDCSVNGAIDPEFTDEEGPLWDVDAGFPDEPEDDDEEADEG